MIQFLKIQYKLGRVTETQLNALVLQNRITQEQKAEIMQSGN